MLWVFIRSASMELLMSTHKTNFSREIRKIFLSTHQKNLCEAILISTINMFSFVTDNIIIVYFSEKIKS